MAPEIEVHKYEVTLGERPDDPRDCNIWLISGSARGVYNELSVSAKPAFLARTNDTFTTFKEKTKLLNDPNVGGLRIKVVTVNNVVYFMESLDEKEGGQVASGA